MTRRDPPACCVGDADHELAPTDEQGIDMCTVCGTEFVICEGQTLPEGWFCVRTTSRWPTTPAGPGQIAVTVPVVDADDVRAFLDKHRPMGDRK